MKVQLLVKQVMDISEELKFDTTGLSIQIINPILIRLSKEGYNVNCSNFKQIYDTIKYLKQEQLCK